MCRGVGAADGREEEDCGCSLVLLFPLGTVRGKAGGTGSNQVRVQVPLL